MTTTNPGLARWGISGDDWREIRPMRDRNGAYDWAFSLADGSRKTPAGPINIYLDEGDGDWKFVDRIPIGASRQVQATAADLEAAAKETSR